MRVDTNHERILIAWPAREPAACGDHRAIKGTKDVGFAVTCL